MLSADNIVIRYIYHCCVSEKYFESSDPTIKDEARGKCRCFTTKMKLHGSQANSKPRCSKPKAKIDASDIVFNVYSYFKSEKEKGRLYISIDILVKRTLAATGIRSRTTLNKVVLPRHNKQSGKAILSQPSMDTTVDTLAFRPKCRGLDKFNQDVLRKTIFDLHNER